MGSTVDLQRDGVIATVTLDRPDRLNALTYGLVDELTAVVRELQRDRSTRVVLLTGSGRGFCAGLDLDEDLDRELDGTGVIQTRLAFQRDLGNLTAALRELHQPVIAAVHGPAAGGGFALALAADLRVLDATARLVPGFIRIGLGGAEMGVSWLLPRTVGLSVAAELLYTGRAVEADEAFRIGLASRVVDAGEDLAEAWRLAEQITANSPLGVRMTKEVLMAGAAASDLRTAIAVENRTQILCSLTDDFRETVAAFHERRTPRHQDR